MAGPTLERLSLMNFQSFRTLFSHMGFRAAAAKRTAKVRNGWGIETEKLEDRALLSAGKSNVPADVHVASAGKSHGKAQEIPNVAGNFSVNITASDTPLGDIDVTDSSVDFAQTGKKVTGNFSAEGATAGIVAKLKGDGLTQALVKAKVNIFGQAFTAKMTVTYDSVNHFSGNATIKKFGNINVQIEGTRNVG